MSSSTSNILETERNISLIIKKLADIYNRELLAIIEWAKQIPGFSSLKLSNQMRLLESTWIEVFMFCLAWRSLPNTGRLNFSPDFFLDERLASQCHCLDLYYHCITIVNKLQQLKPTNEHYFILKALILLNSDVKLDEPQPLLERLRDSFLNRLTNSVIASYPHQALRVTQNMFLILPSLRQADQINRQFWSSLYWNRLVKIDQFLAEMLGIKFHS